MNNKRYVTMVMNRIKKGQTFSLDFGHADKKIDSGFHSMLSQALRTEGWKHYETGSYCKVASGETHMTNGDFNIEVITASFLGTFTDVRVYRAG